MGRRIVYYCDCCKLPVKNKCELIPIEVTPSLHEEFMKKEICFGCFIEYANKIGKVAKDMFG